ncbi:MAG: class I SAM-dependent methyltransferase [Gammaproteobacteria bacterium]|nr:class I SAM-dependent methyltransferase [Gammaproteobacteria bacterium]NIR83306.1 class I SAM-dependent methyltransferase [Gammaproteobacteria bacterium]NIR91106.1 class I SAM-dependent methyltransferase [Gammaproteobacteria bacterium]NIU04473.1 class I SAM-dependent methyltransferase [Gammaproteobacteria bacterium]NIW87109.1 methyltransferase domain-containing protein [Gammaproteobacteria bacterium]
MTTDVVHEHYRRLAQSYDDLLSYSGDFVRCLSKKIVEKLRLRPDDVFVDVGGGTGMYTADILEQVPLRHPVTLVDPFAEMLAKAPPELPVRRVCMDALTFSAQPGHYDKVLMKESVHHVQDRPALFGNLHRRLNPGGILLLVHIPPVIDYPLFEAALERSKTWHADPDQLARQLEAAGFTVERDALDYRHVIDKEAYFRMVRHRYMSLLSSFSDEELAVGLQEMAERYADRDMLEFNDHFDYLTASKR